MEYCSNGLWGTVDDYNFDIRDGQVVCRRLGYQQPGECSTTINTKVDVTCSILLLSFN